MFLLVFFGRVAQRDDVLVAEERIAVEGHLGIEDAHAAVLHDDQRVDLEQAHVLLDEGLVEDREEFFGVGARFAFELQRIGQRLQVVSGDALIGIDRNGDDLFRRMLGNCLDIHAALGRNHEGNLADGAIDEDREIEFAVDVGAVLDIEAVDLLAGRAGLLGHQRIAEHILGIGNDLVDRFRQPHAALGIGPEFLELALAAAAGMDLALHDVKRSRQLFRGRFGFVGGEDRDTFRDRRAVALQQSLGLIFMDVHEFFPV
ncbi:hypothetical protein ABIE78_006275 [Sinorhizobium fredii]